VCLCLHLIAQVPGQSALDLQDIYVRSNNCRPVLCTRRRSSVITWQSRYAGFARLWRPSFSHSAAQRLCSYSFLASAILTFFQIFFYYRLHYQVRSPLSVGKFAVRAAASNNTLSSFFLIAFQRCDFAKRLNIWPTDSVSLFLSPNCSVLCLQHILKFNGIFFKCIPRAHYFENKGKT